MLKKSLPCPSLYSVTDANHAASVPVQAERPTSENCGHHSGSRNPEYRPSETFKQGLAYP